MADRKLFMTLGLSLALTLAATGCSRHDPAGGASASAAQVGGPFQLTDQNGRAVDQRLLQGKWSAVFFGYTYCPDVCPTTLQTLGSASELLGAKAKSFQVVFITVDPQRDTPAQLKDYLSSSSFPRGIIGLTGTQEQIGKAASAYKVYFQKSGNGTDYSVDHSSAIYLMNPQGNFDSVVQFGLTPEQTCDQISKAMSKAG